MSNLLSFKELEMLKCKEINFLKNSYCFNKNYNLSANRNYFNYNFLLEIPDIYLRKNLKNRLRYLGYSYLGYVIVSHRKLSKEEVLEKLSKNGSKGLRLNEPIYKHVFEKLYNY